MDSQIVEEFRQFYQSLYSEGEPDRQDASAYLEASKFTRLPEAQAMQLEDPILPEEVISAIARLKLDKSPGPDGYPALFYRTFCGELAPLLMRLFNSFLDSGAVTDSMSEAAISVILKPHKDPALCSSYRPISLLNIDAKVFAGVLAARLNLLMAGLIDPDQAGFIPTRQGGIIQNDFLTHGQCSQVPQGGHIPVRGCGESI